MERSPEGLTQHSEIWGEICIQFQHNPREYDTSKQWITMREKNVLKWLSGVFPKKLLFQLEVTYQILALLVFNKILTTKINFVDVAIIKAHILPSPTYI